MTFIAAAHRENDLVFVSDTAVTSSEAAINADYSYFEQLKKQDEGMVVEESAMKLFQISDTELVAFSGDVDVGLGVIQFLYDHKDVDIKERLQKINSSLGPY